MNIVVEGVDATGKTTLVNYLYRRLHLQVQWGEGPPQSPDEVNARTRRYLKMHDTIFDRHPCASNKFYDRHRGVSIPIDHRLVDDFLVTPPIFVYCDPGFEVHAHVRAEHDTDEQMALVEQNYKMILSDYRCWAAHYAHINYRIGDSMIRIGNMLESIFHG